MHDPLGELIFSTVIAAEEDDESISFAFDNGAKFVAYNKYKITKAGGGIDIECVIGKKVIKIQNDDRAINIVFENNIDLIVDLSDEAYNGPEAANLFLPNSIIVVWN